MLKKANALVNRKLCKKCGLCSHFCPEKVIETGSDNYPIITHPERCKSCRLCFFLCPDFALEVRENNEAG